MIRRHASTLEELALTHVPYQSIGEFNNGQPWEMPALRTLSIDNLDFTFNLVWRFAQCPKLRVIELATLEEMDPKQLADLIEKTRSQTSQEAGGFPSLKTIALSNDWPDATQDVAMESLELICFEHGITLIIEPLDSDEEDDDDDVSFEDDDDVLENEYWDDEGGYDVDPGASDEEDDDDDDDIELP